MSEEHREFEDTPEEAAEIIRRASDSTTPTFKVTVRKLPDGKYGWYVSHVQSGGKCDTNEEAERQSKAAAQKLASMYEKAHAEAQKQFAERVGDAVKTLLPNRGAKKKETVQ